MADRFIKMHGLGNDFVVIDARAAPVAMTAARAHAIADRRHGIGCDQLILLEPATAPGAELKMRIFNADGGEVEACGNATRCVAALIGHAATIETLGGLLQVVPADGGAQVTLNPPQFEWDAIPLAMPMDTRDMPVGWSGGDDARPCELARPIAVNVGNPHVVFLVPEADAVPLDQIGAIIEHDPLFPERVNVNVASVDGPDRLQLRVWERGVGLTQACGTGACASAVAAIRAGKVVSPVTVTQPGGDLVIAWQPGEAIVMTGPATTVFEGETDWERFG